MRSAKIVRIVALSIIACVIALTVFFSLFNMIIGINEDLNSDIFPGWNTAILLFYLFISVAFELDILFAFRFLLSEKSRENKCKTVFLIISSTLSAIISVFGIAVAVFDGEVFSMRADQIVLFSSIGSYFAVKLTYIITSTLIKDHSQV